MKGGVLTACLSWLRTDTDEFMQNSLAHFQNQMRWAHLTPNQATISLVWRTSWRPIAVIYTLVQQRAACYPAKLFLLLSQDRQAAQEFITCAGCLLDGFSLAFRQLYNTVDLVLGPCAQNTLTMIAQMAATSTLTTEVLHSRNARKLRTRVQSQQMDMSRPWK